MADLCVNAARHPVDLDGGRMLVRGESAKVDLASPHNQGLVDSGQLVVVGRADENLAALKVDELHARAQARGLEHEHLTKSDLVKALEADRKES